MRDPVPVPVAEATRRILRLHPGAVVDLVSERISGLAVEVAERRAAQGSLIVAAVESFDHRLQLAGASRDVARIVRRHLDLHAEQSDAELWDIAYRVDRDAELDGKAVGLAGVRQLVESLILEREARIAETVAAVVAEHGPLAPGRIWAATRLLGGR